MRKLLHWIAIVRLRYTVWRVTRKQNNKHVIMFDYNLRTDGYISNQMAWYGTGAGLKSDTDTIVGAIDRCVRAYFRMNKDGLSLDTLCCNNWCVDGVISRNPTRVVINVRMARSNSGNCAVGPTHHFEG